jgi:hypothetical protein
VRSDLSKDSKPRV